MKEEITKAEQSLLDYCKELEWGKFEVEVKNGQPVFTHYRFLGRFGEVVKDVKLAP